MQEVPHAQACHADGELSERQVKGAQPGPALITSTDNGRIKAIRRLSTRAERERTKLFLVEGTRFLAAAVGQDAEIETLVVAPNLLHDPFARDLVRRLRRSGVPTLDVTPRVFEGLSRAPEPQGIVAVVRQRWTPLEQVAAGQGLCWVALDSVQFPGNLGSVIRTADAVGAAGIMLIGRTTDPLDPATVRATMGSIFAQRLVRTSADELLMWARRHAYAIVGTSPTASHDYHDLRYPERLILMLGSEQHGLSPVRQAACDLTVRIPMAGRLDSLNLAVAASVVLYEVFNQRRSVPARADRAEEYSGLTTSRPMIGL